MNLQELETPALLLDRQRLEHNIEKLRAHLKKLGVALRPHVKTSKSIDVVRLALEGQPGGITVSTLKEAEYFFEHGIRDITYAVGLAPVKLPHVIDLIRRGATLTVILDNVAAATAAADAARDAGVVIPILIELDVDGHRSGVAPDAPQLIEVGRSIASSRALELRGVMTHAGESYNCPTTDAIAQMAERERAGSVHAADRLRAAGLPSPVVSVGSTPTATFARSLAGVTEVRAGVYMFQDLVMAGLDVCDADDIAISVLVSVIGHQADRGWVITDGGWMSLSRDRGTQKQRVDQGFGLVRDVKGDAPPEDLIIVSVNQEHGIVGRRDGKPFDLSRYPVGSLLRVLPNHACATAGQFPAYRVVEGRGSQVVTTWNRVNGW
jgi:D-serine deaminase-like pyridoxal phosphate-dependent protein